MSDKILDFPQDELPEDEISKKEAPIRRPRRPRGKSILGKFLFVILIAAIIIGGILLIQQSLLDLEAQAQVYAVQTAAVLSNSKPGISTTVNSTPASSPLTETTLTPIPVHPTSTSNL
jgi:hypothetical protein